MYNFQLIMKCVICLFVSIMINCFKSMIKYTCISTCSDIWHRFNNKRGYCSSSWIYSETNFRSLSFSYSLLDIKQQTTLTKVIEIEINNFAKFALYIICYRFLILLYVLLIKVFLFILNSTKIYFLFEIIWLLLYYIYILHSDYCKSILTYN